MSEPLQHSPGPWSVEQDDIGWEFIRSADRGNVAEMAGIQGSPGKPSANARLIAAAPDMLRLLREIVSHADPYCRTETGYATWWNGIGQAEALIARLDGAE